MKPLDLAALFSVADATARLLHDLSKAHFILQGGELTSQSRKQLNENAFETRIKWLTVAIEQPNRSQVLHVPSRDRREGGRRDKRFVFRNDAGVYDAWRLVRFRVRLAFIDLPDDLAGRSFSKSR